MATTDWLDELRKECEASSQAKVAERLGVSTAMINQVLRGKYKCSTARLAERVRGELLNKTVKCPVMEIGVITVRRCQDFQVRPLSTINPTQGRLWIACRKCPHSDPSLLARGEKIG